MNIKKCIRKLIPIVAICAIALAFAWLVIPLYLQSAISGLVQTSLSDLLGVPVSVRTVDVDLSRRKAALYGLRISQPDGFGNGSLLYAPEIETVIRISSLLSGTLEIFETRIAKVELNIRTDAEGQNNLKSLLDAIRARPGNDGAKAEQRAGPIKSIYIRSLTVEDSAAIFRESVETKTSLEIAIENIIVNASELRWGRQKAIGMNTPGLVRATGRLRQRPFPDGRCGAVLKTDDLSGEFPSLNCHLRFIGIELADFAPVLPKGTAAMLGGNALDLFIDMKINGKSLTGQAEIETIAGYKYDATLSGLPTAPILTTDHDALAYVLSRTQGGFANFFRNLSHAGQGAGGAVVDTATDLAQGTVKTVGSFGQGLIQTAKGIVTLDSTDIGQGTSEMGTTLTGGARNAVFSASGNIIEGVGNISGSLSGDDKADKWRSNIPARWTNAWQDAINTAKHDRTVRDAETGTVKSL